MENTTDGYLFTWHISLISQADKEHDKKDISYSIFHFNFKTRDL